ncbi:hypothetical protein T265_12014 [Opisthorchis viverrini]|uniref:Uncharacterized protein n=1 Tax=Opisthorchis viverrini TaxID=6198 RepID=A0A074ZV75_OPIVI|nr:hypothetical protein T265_12014 [Opisthorchis viverrini]KER19089.1 hypothetical protein T265_12014 [Opisthorchis viverrini]
MQFIIQKEFEYITKKNEEEIPTSPIRLQDHWVSSKSLSMIDARKVIPTGNEYDSARKSLKRLRKDREL